VYHLEGLRVPLVVRVPQFENHWHIGISKWRNPWAPRSTWKACVVMQKQYWWDAYIGTTH